MDMKHEQLILEALKLCLLINAETSCGASYCLYPTHDSIDLCIQPSKMRVHASETLFFRTIFLDTMVDTEESIQRAFLGFKTFALKLFREENFAAYKRIKGEF